MSGWEVISQYNMNMNMNIIHIDNLPNHCRKNGCVEKFPYTCIIFDWRYLSKGRFEKSQLVVVICVSF